MRSSTLDAFTVAPRLESVGVHRAHEHAEAFADRLAFALPAAAGADLSGRLVALPRRAVPTRAADRTVRSPAPGCESSAVSGRNRRAVR